MKAVMDIPKKNLERFMDGLVRAAKGKKEFLDFFKKGGKPEDYHPKDKRHIVRPI